MSLQDIYNMAASGAWAVENPLDCACNGSGWMSSDVDTWHECPIHSFKGNPHPEYATEDTDWDAIEELGVGTAGRLLKFIVTTARELGVDESGYRVVTNVGDDAQQAVKHLHCHIIGGARMGGMV